MMSSVGIATAYGLDDLAWIPGRGRDCSLLHSNQTGPEVHSVSYLMRTGTPSAGEKRPGREANYSPSSWSYIFTPHVSSALCCEHIVDTRRPVFRRKIQLKITQDLLLTEMYCDMQTHCQVTTV
jgi:hypothetical protein